jgi:hypothetical protein
MDAVWPLIPGIEAVRKCKIMNIFLVHILETGRRTALCGDII